MSRPNIETRLNTLARAGAQAGGTLFSKAVLDVLGSQPFPIPMNITSEYLEETSSTSKNPKCRYHITPLSNNTLIEALKVSFDVVFENGEETQNSLERQKVLAELNAKILKLADEINKLTAEQDLLKLNIQKANIKHYLQLDSGTYVDSTQSDRIKTALTETLKKDCKDCLVTEEGKKGLSPFTWKKVGELDTDKLKTKLTKLNNNAATEITYFTQSDLAEHRKNKDDFQKNDKDLFKMTDELTSLNTQLGAFFNRERIFDTSTQHVKQVITTNPQADDKGDIAALEEDIRGLNKTKQELETQIKNIESDIKILKIQYYLKFQISANGFTSAEREQISKASELKEIFSDCLVTKNEAGLLSGKKEGELDENKLKTKYRQLYQGKKEQASLLQAINTGLVKKDLDALDAKNKELAVAIKALEEEKKKIKARQDLLDNIKNKERKSEFADRASTNFLNILLSSTTATPDEKRTLFIELYRAKESEIIKNPSSFYPALLDLAVKLQVSIKKDTDGSLTPESERIIGLLKFYKTNVQDFELPLLYASNLLSLMNDANFSRRKGEFQQLLERKNIKGTPEYHIPLDDAVALATYDIRGSVNVTIDCKNSIFIFDGDYNFSSNNSDLINISKSNAWSTNCNISNVTIQLPKISGLSDELNTNTLNPEDLKILLAQYNTGRFADISLFSFLFSISDKEEKRKRDLLIQHYVAQKIIDSLVTNNKDISSENVRTFITNHPNINLKNIKIRDKLDLQVDASISIVDFVSRLQSANVQLTKGVVIPEGISNQLTQEQQRALKLLDTTDEVIQFLTNVTRNINNQKVANQIPDETIRQLIAHATYRAHGETLAPIDGTVEKHAISLSSIQQLYNAGYREFKNLTIILPERYDFKNMDAIANDAFALAVLRQRGQSSTTDNFDLDGAEFSDYSVIGNTSDNRIVHFSEFSTFARSLGNFEVSEKKLLDAFNSGKQSSQQIKNMLEFLSLTGERKVEKEIFLKKYLVGQVIKNNISKKQSFTSDEIKNLFLASDRTHLDFRNIIVSNRLDLNGLLPPSHEDASKAINHLLSIKFENVYRTYNTDQAEFKKGVKLPPNIAILLLEADLVTLEKDVTPKTLRKILEKARNNYFLRKEQLDSVTEEKIAIPAARPSTDTRAADQLPSAVAAPADSGAAAAAASGPTPSVSQTLFQTDHDATKSPLRISAKKFEQLIKNKQKFLPGITVSGDVILKNHDLWDFNLAHVKFLEKVTFKDCTINNVNFNGAQFNGGIELNNTEIKNSNFKGATATTFTADTIARLQGDDVKNPSVACGIRANETIYRTPLLKRNPKGISPDDISEIKISDITLTATVDKIEYEFGPAEHIMGSVETLYKDISKWYLEDLNKNKITMFRSNIIGQLNVLDNTNNKLTTRQKLSFLIEHSQKHPGGRTSQALIAAISHSLNRRPERQRQIYKEMDANIAESKAEKQRAEQRDYESKSVAEKARIDAERSTRLAEQRKRESMSFAEKVDEFVKTHGGEANQFSSLIDSLTKHTLTHALLKDFEKAVTSSETWCLALTNVQKADFVNKLTSIDSALSKELLYVLSNAYTAEEMKSTQGIPTPDQTEEHKPILRLEGCVEQDTRVWFDKNQYNLSILKSFISSSSAKLLPDTSEVLARINRQIKTLEATNTFITAQDPVASAFQAVMSAFNNNQLTSNLLNTLTTLLAQENALLILESKSKNEAALRLEQIVKENSSLQERLNAEKLLLILNTALIQERIMTLDDAALNHPKSAFREAVQLKSPTVTTAFKNWLDENVDRINSLKTESARANIHPELKTIIDEQIKNIEERNALVKINAEATNAFIKGMKSLKSDELNFSLFTDLNALITEENSYIILTKEQKAELRAHLTTEFSDATFSVEKTVAEKLIQAIDLLDEPAKLIDSTAREQIKKNQAVLKKFSEECITEIDRMAEQWLNANRANLAALQGFDGTEVAKFLPQNSSIRESIQTRISYLQDQNNFIISCKPAADKFTAVINALKENRLTDALLIELTAQLADPEIALILSDEEKVQLNVTLQPIIINSDAPTEIKTIAEKLREIIATAITPEKVLSGKDLSVSGALGDKYGAINQTIQDVRRTIDSAAHAWFVTHRDNLEALKNTDDGSPIAQLLKSCDQKIRDNISHRIALLESVEKNNSIAEAFRNVMNAFERNQDTHQQITAFVQLVQSHYESSFLFLTNVELESFNYILQQEIASPVPQKSAAANMLQTFIKNAARDFEVKNALPTSRPDLKTLANILGKNIAALKEHVDTPTGPVGQLKAALEKVFGYEHIKNARLMDGSFMPNLTKETAVKNITGDMKDNFPKYQFAERLHKAMLEKIARIQDAFGDPAVVEQCAVELRALFLNAASHQPIKFAGTDFNNHIKTSLKEIDTILDSFNISRQRAATEQTEKLNSEIANQQRLIDAARHNRNFTNENLGGDFDSLMQTIGVKVRTSNRSSRGTPPTAAIDLNAINDQLNKLAEKVHSDSCDFYLMISGETKKALTSTIGTTNLSEPIKRALQQIVDAAITTPPPHSECEGYDRRLIPYATKLGDTAS